MKKIFLALALLTVSLAGVAQESMFKDGLRKGRLPKSFYSATNDKGSGMTIQKAESYAQKKGYLIGGYTTKRIARFGDYATVLDMVEFLPRDEYQQYLFEFAPGDVSYDKLVSTGSCWAFMNSEFVRIDGVKWSGTVTDGMLSGQGTGFFQRDGINYLLSGTFLNGFPQGVCNFGIFHTWDSDVEKVEYQGLPSVEVRPFHDGIARYSEAGGKWGFVSQSGKVLIYPSYETVINDFKDGRAEVMHNGKEIVIGTDGGFIEYTARQKQIDAEEEMKAKLAEMKRQQEAKQREIERKQKAIEEERLRQEAEKRRVAAFKKAQPGDKVYYSQDYEWSSGGWFFRSSGRYSMRIICFVEQNVNEGERLQIRVGSVESTDRDRYSTPVIDGIEYRKGDVIWIKPLYDSKWHIEGE